MAIQDLHQKARKQRMEDWMDEDDLLGGDPRSKGRYYMVKFLVAPYPHGEAVVLELVVRVGLIVILSDVHWWLETHRVGGHPDPGTEH